MFMQTIEDNYSVAQGVVFPFHLVIVHLCIIQALCLSVKAN